MSNIANTHTVVEYTSGSTKPLTGQRLSVHSWKTDKSEYKRPSVAVSIPGIASEEITSNIAALVPSIQAFLQDTQDKMIRERLNAAKHGEVLHVTEDELSVASIVEYLESSNESGRLTKETVVEWFNTSISDSLMLQLAEKLGVSEVPTDAESARIEAVVSEFRNKISSLAGGKTTFPVQIAKQLKKAVELVDSDSGDVLRDKFVARLDKMIAAPIESSLLNAL